MEDIVINIEWFGEIEIKCHKKEGKGKKTEKVILWFPDCDKKNLSQIVTVSSDECAYKKMLCDMAQVCKCLEFTRNSVEIKKRGKKKKLVLKDTVTCNQLYDQLIKAENGWFLLKQEFLSPLRLMLNGNDRKAAVDWKGLQLERACLPGNHSGLKVADEYFLENSAEKQYYLVCKSKEGINDRDEKAKKMNDNQPSPSLAPIGVKYRSDLNSCEHKGDDIDDVVEQAVTSKVSESTEIAKTGENSEDRHLLLYLEGESLDGWDGFSIEKFKRMREKIKSIVGELENQKKDWKKKKINCTELKERIENVEWLRTGIDKIISKMRKLEGRKKGKKNVPFAVHEYLTVDFKDNWNEFVKLYEQNALIPEIKTVHEVAKLDSMPARSVSIKKAVVRIIAHPFQAFRMITRGGFKETEEFTGFRNLLSDTFKHLRPAEFNSLLSRVMQSENSSQVTRGVIDDFLTGDGKLSLEYTSKQLEEEQNLIIGQVNNLIKTDRDKEKIRENEHKIRNHEFQMKLQKENKMEKKMAENMAKIKESAKRKKEDKMKLHTIAISAYVHKQPPSISHFDSPANASNTDVGFSQRRYGTVSHDQSKVDAKEKQISKKSELKEEEKEVKQKLKDAQRDKILHESKFSLKQSSEPIQMQRKATFHLFSIEGKANPWAENKAGDNVKVEQPDKEGKPQLLKSEEEQSIPVVEGVVEGVKVPSEVKNTDKSPEGRAVSSDVSQRPKVKGVRRCPKPYQSQNKPPSK